MAGSSSNGAETTRVVVGKNTIPEYDSLTGSLTTSGIATVLGYTGSLTAQDVFGPDLQKAAEGTNLFVYESTSTNGSVRKIKGIFTPDSGVTWSILIDSAFASPLVGEGLKIVTADLQDYSVANTGASAGVYDGVAYASGAVVNRDENSNRRAATRNREAKAVNATGTSFLIIENK
jgi:hypothetical protein